MLFDHVLCVSNEYLHRCCYVGVLLLGRVLHQILDLPFTWKKLQCKGCREGLHSCISGSGMLSSVSESFVITVCTLVLYLQSAKKVCVVY